MPEKTKVVKASLCRQRLAVFTKSDRRWRRKQAAAAVAKYARELADVRAKRIAEKRFKDQTRRERIKASREQLVKPVFDH